MLIFHHPSDLQRVLDAPPLPRVDMALRFRRWSRLVTAEWESMRFRVLLEIRGIPAHAWSVAAAQVILDGACAIPEPTPSTSVRADSRRFQAAVWCADPDLIPNEVIVRIPERVKDLGTNNLFLRPEEHHELPVLRYKVEIEILEIQDWNVNSSSDGNGTLPERALTDTDSEDDYPGFRQSSRSGPGPRRTVGVPSGASADNEGTNSGAPAGDCARRCAPGPSGGPLWRFGRGLPVVSNDPPHSISLRFGSVPPGLLRPAAGRPPSPLLDDPTDILVGARASPMVARDFDPMFDEASGSHGCWLSREVLGGELFPELEAPAPDAQPDPMHLEAGFLSAQPSPALGIVEVARPAATFNTTIADLESIRFDVPEMAPVDCSSSDVSNNVTVARGSRETLPFHLFADNHITVSEHVANFAQSVCREAPPPVLDTSPPRRRSRQPQQEVTIRCSERLARKSCHRATKPVIQAQNVLMKKLGITSDDRPPDASSFQQFTDTFSSTLTKTQCEALDALLPSGMGALAMDTVAPVWVS